MAQLLHTAGSRANLQADAQIHTGSAPDVIRQWTVDCKVQNTPSMKARMASAFGLMTVALSVLGVGRYLFALASGAELSLQQLAYYLGNAAFIVSLAAVAGVFVAGVFAIAAGKSLGEAADDGVWRVWGFSTLAAAAFFFLVSGGGYGFRELDVVGTGAMSALGLVAVAAGVTAWRVSSRDRHEPST
ncbi:hypothetical protein GA707_20300 [Nostocoides sp. F2B08]|uniref:hypothetical protein n=1 Tax=Nostocoides sp. F2B08 TaxID=2653936 RepID=UPI001263E27D|nr:hypothetical protein [Tetrasphaera sp. F2B08]KAB7739551.1 hypothetical protein GA707_20300 [Tetrasphaera sp. F2B08]